MPEQDLANLARLLHHSRNLTAEQIRNRSGFLDNNYDPYIPLGTIQAWLSEGTKGTTEREQISERVCLDQFINRYHICVGANKVHSSGMMTLKFSF